MQHREPEPKMIHNPLWCERCGGLGYVVADAEWEPHAVQCSDCAAARIAAKFPTNAQKRYERLLKAFGELQAAGQKVVDETDRIHDSKPWPVKYHAPYGAITELRKLLARQYGLRALGQ